jgi:hypothetical protein
LPSALAPSQQAASHGLSLGCRLQRMEVEGRGVPVRIPSESSRGPIASPRY